MKLAGDKAEAFSTKPKKGVWSALIFCDDEGVANDAARSLIAAWTQGDPDAELVSFSDDDVKKDPAELFDALEARSLLGAKRVIRVRTNGDKIAAILKEALDAEAQTPGRFEAKLVVTAGALQKKSKLRSAFETDDKAAALHLFADDLGDVSDFIRDGLKRDDIAIGEDAVTALATHLPGHRRIVHAELEKLALYARDLGRPLTLADVQAVSVSGIDASADTYVSAVFERDLPAALDALDRLAISGTSPITLIRALQRETQKLLAVAALGSGAGPEAGMKLRPPIFRSQWAIVSRRARAWPAPVLARILERIYDLEHQAKMAGPIAEAALRHLTVQMARTPTSRKAS